MPKDVHKIRRWMLNEFGDGAIAPCALCGTPLTLQTMTIDHFPIPACLGGTYAHDNVRPACWQCNQADGAEMSNDPTLMRIAQDRRIRVRRNQNEGIDRRNATFGRLTYTLQEVWP